ncbi:MAG: hypothetical protein V1872_03810 [bacterium]
MSSQPTSIFQEVLDTVESLSESQQEDLIDIIQHRLREHRRDLFAENVREGKKEYDKGEGKKGTVDELMRNLLK